MKKIGIISALVFAGIAFCPSIEAQDYKTALGIRISSQDAAVNHSIILKQFFSNSIAIEGLLSFGDPVTLGILIEKHKPVGINSLNWFWGGGAYFGFSGERTAGIQGVLGIDYKVPLIPFNLSIDWKPEINIAKDLSFEPAAVALSARFVLK